MDPAWQEAWTRLAAANARASRERLRRLTLEEGLAKFEALCREVHAAFPTSMPARSHAVGLARFWKQR